MLKTAKVLMQVKKDRVLLNAVLRAKNLFTLILICSKKKEKNTYLGWISNV